MKRTSFALSVVALMAGFLAIAAAAEKKTGTAKVPAHQMYSSSDIKWMEGPPVLPPGAKIAVLEGDPAKPGYFALRLRLPDRYRIMPHWHPNVERITVISGTFNVGFGDAFDDSQGHPMSAGTYAKMSPRLHHFAWATGETEIQLTTLGPWKLVYVDPKDDPSKK